MQACCSYKTWTVIKGQELETTVQEQGFEIYDYKETRHEYRFDDNKRATALMDKRECKSKKTCIQS